MRRNLVDSLLFAVAAGVVLSLVLGCTPMRLRAAELPQVSLRLPQSVVNTASCPCQCPCSQTGVCTCADGNCQCQNCPGGKRAALSVYLDKAKAENKRVVVWTGTPGHLVDGCVTVRNDSDMAPSRHGRSFVTVGVPSSQGFTWFTFPVNTPDWALSSCKTDGTCDEPAQPAMSYYQAPQFLACAGGNCH